MLETLKEISNKLEDLLKAVEYQTTIMENVFHQKDAAQHMQDIIQKNTKMMSNQIREHPAFKANPQMADATISMMNILAGGGIKK